MSKKIASLAVLAAFLLTAAAACPGLPGSAHAAGKYADFPQKPITYIITASAGGGLDICARMLAPYFEKALGNNAVVTVVNKTGGANWVGWQAMFAAPADGYTMANIHTPQCYSYLNQTLQNKNNLESFNLICNAVTDSGTIVIRSDDERFKDVKDLKGLAAYLKANEDKKFMVSLTSKGGADELAMFEFRSQAKLGNLVGVNHSKGIAAQKTAFLGKNTDLYFGKVGDSIGLKKDGIVRVLAVLSDKRSPSMPDVPTAKEQGFDIVVGSSRGIVMQPSLDPALKEVIVTALRKASQDPAYLKAMEEAGYEVDFKEGKEYEDYMKAQEAIVARYAEELGYNRQR